MVGFAGNLQVNVRKCDKYDGFNGMELASKV
jgi:hypothetical protein